MPLLYFEEAFWFFLCPLSWHWWLSKEVQGAIKDSVFHHVCFSRGIIFKRWFRRIKFFLSFRRKITNFIAICMCLNAKKKIHHMHLLEKQSHSLGLAESSYVRLPPLLPCPFPWACWRWGITFDEIQDCGSIHHGIKIRSGKCSSCIFNILRFLLS